MGNQRKISIRGARVHNLKNINLDIPKDSLVVISGLSGSGKSSLAFDTLYAEGQRRYVESLSAYARQFLEMMEKPDVDYIENLSPAISIEQKSVSKNPRSNVATTTEIYDYLRLLYARAGDVHCPSCDQPVNSYSVQQMVDIILGHEEGAKVEILAPVVMGRKGTHKKLLDTMLQQGFVRAYVNGELHRLEDPIKLDKNLKHNVSIVIDRLKITSGLGRRVTETVETATKLSEGIIELKFDNHSMLLSENYACLDCNISIGSIEPRTFSFNNPYGACTKCDGLGEIKKYDIDLIVPDKTLSIRDGAVKAWDKSTNYKLNATINAVTAHFGIDQTKPWQKISQEHQDTIIYGSDESITITRHQDGNELKEELVFDGVVKYLRSLNLRGGHKGVEFSNKFMSLVPCESCDGKRLRPEALSVYIDKKNIHDIVSMNIENCYKFVKNLNIDGQKKEVAEKISREIIERLKFLNDVGLGYLTLSRRSGTLSGGESQRIRLATQIGSGLTGVLYVLDEPSIGLHQRDNNMLLSTLKYLRDLGNTVLVVEHDEDTMLESDYVIDLGPKAGRLGGEIVFTGTPTQLLKSKKSSTGKFLSGREVVALPKTRRKPSDKYISIRGAKEHNLKNINVDIPISLLTCVTGVSGSGKSTLILDILYPYMMQKLHGSAMKPGDVAAISGIDNIDKVIEMDQSPIGRTPRSNPVTYTGILTNIRELYAKMPESKKRGYLPGRFSFNAKGGRCEKCSGDGLIKIEMHFMPDIYVKCDACNGTRYNRDTLDIKYNGLNIAEVLDLTVEQALDVFQNIPDIYAKLQVLVDVGMDYVKLGQSSTTLSGGEAQRIKMAKELMKRSTGKTLYIFDEPTTGLHFEDVKKLVAILDKLVDSGNTVIVIEHNLDVIKSCDYIIDLGREGGDRGGDLLYAGELNGIADCEESFTAKYLAEKL